MQLLSTAIADSIDGSSLIRRMFEAGIALKREHGEESVCDFSLGNPDLPPPPAVAEGLRALSMKMEQPFALGYMPNGGYDWARKALAAHLSWEHGVSLTEEEVILTCGAAGGLNAFFKATLNPGDQVLGIAPYFVEYGAYVGNHGGVFRTVASRPDTFDLDLDALDDAITPQTRALILNSPNNPTGQIYGRRELADLCALLARKMDRSERPIFLVADEPYRFLAYDGVEVPSLLPLYPYAVVASSFSKNLSMPGERIGYLALSPLMEGREKLMAGLLLANRILGFVNPPVIGQHLMAAALGSQVDVAVYERRRNAMAAVLTDAGYEFFLPKGAFYFFPKAPGGDDASFADTLRRHLVLGVSGSAFGGPGHFRLAFCVDEAIIHRAAPGLKAAIRSTRP
ncbi:MAG: pyridoxal phosphate-dependent aminotransferase [Desulfovibrio sp.]|jgi:aspartate aminotransferase|nr:pyridoxal phosphate-dependent aminotransferase [Desulfovibrio sp.]